MNWYSYARNTRGRQACNGSLVLVTGCHMTSAWAMAIFPYSPLGKYGYSTLTYFRSGGWGQGDDWRIARSGPRVVDPNVQNQCVFIRGFVMEEIQQVKTILSPPSGMFGRRKRTIVNDKVVGKVRSIQEFEPTGGVIKRSFLYLHFIVNA